FTVDMVPVVRSWWDPNPDELVEDRKLLPVGKGTARLTGGKPTDFLEYRGKDRAGIVTGPELAVDWAAQPPKRLWRQPIGGGYSGFTVEGNALVTLEQRRKQEVVACYDTATGGKRWEHGYEALFEERLGGNGPRATPTIADGN